MLVAKKEMYYYDRYQKSSSIKRVIKKKSTKKTTMKLQLFLYSTLVLVISLGLLLRLAYISELQHELTKLDKQSTELQEIKDLKTIRLEKIKESRWIQDTAEKLLGMKYAQDEQIVFLHLDNNSYEIEDLADNNEGETSVLKSIKSVIGKLLLITNVVKGG